MFHQRRGVETTWKKNDAILIVGKSADGDGDGDGNGDDRRIGGRDECRRRWPVASHLGILVGCKMEEEPRRIRDVVNLSRLLGLPLREDDDNGMRDDREDDNG